MITINVFIASSLELSEQRILIGDFIRRLSYDYTPRGVRFHMMCWEDFYPEYDGKSKQTEYDEQLIRECDIFVALFRTRCGKYTQHEIHYALNLNKECHILQLPTKEDNDELKFFLEKLKISVVQCTNEHLICCINDIINEYMCNHHVSLSTNATPTNNWRLYATIPDDYSELRVPFSNMIRGLESILEDTLGNYFILHPYHTVDNIASTDHYICFMKDSWTTADEEEIKIAYHNCHDGNLPETSMLYQIKGHCGVEKNQLAIKINSEYNGFSKTYDSIDTIKSDLTLWALRHKSIVALDTETTFSIEGENICLYGRPFFYLPMYPILQKSINTLTDAIDEIDKKIRRNIKDGRVIDEILAIKLANQRQHKELTLQNEITRWYNNTQLQQSANTIWTNSQIKSIKNEQLRKYQELTESVNINTQLCGHDNSVQHLHNLSSILLEWESAAEICMYQDEIQAKDFIQVLTYIIQICDTYLTPSRVDFDEDTIIKKIIDTADKYNYHTLFTEVMRVNYANSYTKRLDYKSAGRFYAEAYKQILQINEESIQAHHYKSYVISSLLHYYVDIDNKTAVLNVGEKYESLIRQWQSSNIHTSYDVDLARCYSCILAAAPKNCEVDANLVQRAEILLEVLHQKYDSQPYNEDYYDAICHFSVVLSTYFIDRYDNGNVVYYNKALRYINESMDALYARYPYDPEHIDLSLSQPFHNRAFLYSKNGEWDKAISNYESALKMRRDNYSKTLDERELFEVAQTCINLGDAYRLNKKLEKAAVCADEALEIYNSKRGKSQEIFDMLYYEAYQLKATILMDSDIEKGSYPNEALAMLHECLEWSNCHPNNDYADRFKGVSGIILQAYKK